MITNQSPFHEIREPVHGDSNTRAEHPLSALSSLNPWYLLLTSSRTVLVPAELTVTHFDARVLAVLLDVRRGHQGGNPRPLHHGREAGAFQTGVWMGQSFPLEFVVELPDPPLSHWGGCFPLDEFKLNAVEHRRSAFRALAEEEHDKGHDALLPGVTCGGGGGGIVDSLCRAW